MYRSRFEASISNWSKRESEAIKQKSPIAFTQSVMTPLKELNDDVVTTTDKYLLSPGKFNYAGMKPVFSNSSNMLK